MFHVRLCRLWLVQGRYDAAEQHLRAALKRHPDTPALLHALANCLDQQCRTDEAIALLAALSAPSPQLVGQLASLRMKQAPEQAQTLQRSITQASAGKLETQQTVVKALASVEDAAARHDLARRVAMAWAQRGVGLVSGLAVGFEPADVSDLYAATANAARMLQRGRG